MIVTILFAGIALNKIRYRTRNLHVVFSLSNKLFEHEDNDKNKVPNLTPTQNSYLSFLIHTLESKAFFQTAENHYLYQSCQNIFSRRAIHNNRQQWGFEYFCVHIYSENVASHKHLKIKQELVYIYVGPNTIFNKF